MRVLHVWFIIIGILSFGMSAYAKGKFLPALWSRSTKPVTFWNKNIQDLYLRARHFEHTLGPGGSAQVVRSSQQSLYALENVFKNKQTLLFEDYSPLPPQVDLAVPPAAFPFLQNLRQAHLERQIWKNAMAQRSNQQLFSFRAVRERQLNLLKKNIPALYENSQYLTVTAAVQKISPSAKYIFLGEYHDLPDLRRQVADVVLTYHYLYPQRQLIFLTELAFDSGSFFTPGKRGYLLADDLWEDLADLVRADVKIGGLEESFNHDVMLEAPLGEVSSRITLEGMRIRNQYWTNVIRYWREKFPDAVIFVHGGTGHIKYTQPLSVAARFPWRETFVFSFLPQDWFHQFRKEVSPYELFHFVTGGEFIKKGVLMWKEASLARMAGFDAQVIF